MEQVMILIVQEKAIYRVFFTAQMMEIQTKGKNISFSIKPGKYFKKPITPISKKINNSPWNIAIKSYKRTYQGAYSDKKLIINSNGFDPRIFIKIKYGKNTGSGLAFF